MGSLDLVSLLQRALLQHHVYLDPVVTPDKPAYDPNVYTLRYVSSLLEENAEEEVEVMQNSPKSFNDLITELSEIVSPTTSSDSSVDSSPESSVSATDDELKSLLIQCAQAVSAKERSKVYMLVDLIQQRAVGTVYERLSLAFAEALVARLTGWGHEVHKASKVLVKDFHSMCSNLPCIRVGHLFAQEMILERSRASKRVHIVDYGVDRGYQWACVIEAFSKRPEGPPYLKITGVEMSSLHHPETGPKLLDYAKSVGVHLLYESIVSDNWETVNPSCRVNQDEVLIVCCCMRLKHLPEDGTTIANPRKLFLENVYRMRPALFLQSEMNANLTGPFFFPRFQEAMRFYFAQTEFSASYLSEELMRIRSKMQGSKIMNIVACEGPDRYERPMSYDKWDQKIRRAGFKQVPLSNEIVGRVEALLGQFQRSNNLGMALDKEWLLVGWKDVVLFGMCGWQPN